MTKENNKIVIFSIQESFMVLFPYLILRAMMTLISLFNANYTVIDSVQLANVTTLFYDLFPLLILISLSMQLSKNFQLNSANFTIASVISFILISGYFTQSNGDIKVHAKESLLFALLIPIISFYFILFSKKLYRLYTKHLLVHEDNILMNAFNYLYLYIPILLFSFTSNATLAQSISKLLFGLFSKMGIETQAFFHLLLSHIIWFFGLHGTTSYRYIFDMDFYTQEIYANFPYETFFSTFVIFGGAGSTLSLILAIFFVSKNRRYRFIAKGSLPFSIFNINEPIIYGLPIVLNKNLILPFIMVPMINFFSSLMLLQLKVLTIANPSIPWTTPPLLSGYLLTDSFVGFSWQLLLITVGILVYLPFIKKEDTLEHQIDRLKNKLSFTNTLNVENQHLLHYSKYQELSTEIDEISKVLSDITQGELLFYYQPQINIRENTIYGFEALIRLKKEDKIYPPTFLSAIEKAGLEETIDMWCVQQIATESHLWATSIHKDVKISINIYPKTLLDMKNVNYIITTLSHLNIQIELLEHGFRNNILLLDIALEKLRSAGFTIALDDYGSKESNLSLLGSLPIDVIKLDRSLIQATSTDTGHSLFIKNSNLLYSFHPILIAEAIETQEELETVKVSDVDIVQGWYFSPALPLDEAVRFSLPNSKTNN